MRYFKSGFALKHLAQIGLIHISAPWGVINVYISILCSWDYLLPFIWQEIQTLILPVPTICFSLSSASPAHSPKEEYVITQSTDTPKEETVYDQSKDQGEACDDKSELTEKKSVTGWLAAHRLSQSNIQRSGSKRRKAALPHFPCALLLFQKRCLSVDCAPPSSKMCRRKESPGRSNWTPTRSSWRRRCRRPGGWCFAYRCVVGDSTKTHTAPLLSRQTVCRRLSPFPDQLVSVSIITSIQIHK